ncbi:hypothetical protein ALP26_01182 [Pseudomonas savastanoi pv. glycinea]|uniref:Uncharacterized protein n=3 Tax=Pseudomonas savastanoi TaxID=29438 RepID=A0A0P9T3L7_PSESG|nr:hypothetical protein [Pseudomonas savastanoi]EFW79517.1 hypothetical protein PsgB076_17476 [Pseudomonas savastanoi pv. glycinea str. B076]EFW85518.1 hypothetical protein PsgRace4_13434 [Pseudomonas savastanoi pv. glycinea str. race 4]EGH16566.1 hypothetical protein Pgy4_26310 [Pseudomonas savastanoi pv. glycinea str. race 4]KPC28023.1 Uncharacterized protein AC498_2738 [Pseudomonas savastanoi pv. glycinea]KPC34196.1 Uncharacterized protein AC497_3977 [Pseudomonas savastanoi pv. glycinea]
MSNHHFSDELAVLEIVDSAHFFRPGKMTSGQLCLSLIRLQPAVPAIGEFMEMIDHLVKEGLLISGAVLPCDASFPYVQHIIFGLTEVGKAVVQATKSEIESVNS